MLPLNNVNNKTVQHLLDLAKNTIVSAKTGSTAKCLHRGDGSFCKIRLLNDMDPLQKKLGITRMMTEFSKDGSIEEMYVEFDVKSSLEGGWGRHFSLGGTVKQWRKTFKYLHATVNRNCNTVTAWERLQKLIRNVIASANEVVHEVRL